MTRVFFVALSILSVSSSALAQEAKSAPLAKQLAAALDAGKLDSIAAKDPSTPGAYVAALYFGGSQLLVVSAQYAVPQLLDDRLTKKEFRDVYIDLNSASKPETKVFIQDSGADGLKAKAEDGQGSDSVEQAGKTMSFDGDWKKQKMTEQDYLKMFSAADEKYAAILNALLGQAKKPSS